MHDKVDEMLQLENWKLHKFEELGLTYIEAIDAVSQEIDWHEVDEFMRLHPECSPHMAVKIV